ncbi:MAG: hypothetical protein WCN98_03345 [Verrucomicrobiaceae bacterium]
MYLFHWESFCRFYKATWPVFPYVIAIPLVWTVTAVFYKNEFQRYSRENSSLDVSADDAGKSGNDEFVPLSQ